MDDIQAENGHVDIANSIVEALCMVQLSGYESRVLWALFRKTYGWHKKEDRISLSQFQALTGLPIPKISNTLNRLVLRKMVSVTENGNGKVKSYGFQKVYSLWQDLPEKVIPKMGISEKGITENRSKGLPKSASTKETITKEKRHKGELLPICKAWKAYLEMRQRSKMKFTDHAKDLAAQKVMQLAAQGQDPVAVLEQSVFKTWQGLFPVKDAPVEFAQRAPASTPYMTEQDRENIRRARERVANE